MNTCKTCLTQYDPRISLNREYCSDVCQKKEGTSRYRDQPLPQPHRHISQGSFHLSTNPYNEGTSIYYMQLNDLRGQIQARDHQIRKDRDELDQLRAENFKLKLENATSEEKNNIAIERVVLDKERAINEKPKNAINGITENPAIIEGLGKVAESLTPIISLFVNKNEQNGHPEGIEKIESTHPETQQQITSLLEIIRTKKETPEAIAAIYNLAIFQEWLPDEVNATIQELNKKYQEKVQQFNQPVDNQHQ